MLHKDILRLLFPLELSGEFDADCALEGARLDMAQASAEQILAETFPDQASILLADWERVCGLTPAADATLQERRNNVVRKLRELGGLSRAYFINIAAAMGYTITITEFSPFRCGINRCGDALYQEITIFIWQVHVADTPLYYFRAGQSGAGELLLSFPHALALENVLNDLKPAHTYIVFDYS